MSRGNALVPNRGSLDKDRSIRGLVVWCVLYHGYEVKDQESSLKLTSWPFSPGATHPYDIIIIGSKFDEILLIIEFWTQILIWDFSNDPKSVHLAKYADKTVVRLVK